MKLETYRRTRPAINLSALVDVLFILIVFVVLAANFDRVRAVDIVLPVGGGEKMTEREVATLRVPSSGPMTLDGRPIGRDDLDDHLRRARGQRDTLILVADGEIALTRATTILSAATRAGFDSVTIATREEETR